MPQSFHIFTKAIFKIVQQNVNIMCRNKVSRCNSCSLCHFCLSNRALVVTIGIVMAIVLLLVASVEDVFSQKISSCSLVCFCWFVGLVGHPFIGLSCNVILGFIYLLIGFQTTC